MSRVKVFRKFKELNIRFGKLDLRFSYPQTAAWWNYKQLFSFGKRK